MEKTDWRSIEENIKEIAVQILPESKMDELFDETEELFVRSEYGTVRPMVHKEAIFVWLRAIVKEMEVPLPEENGDGKS